MVIATPGVDDIVVSRFDIKGTVKVKSPEEPPGVAKHGLRVHHRLRSFIIHDRFLSAFFVTSVATVRSNRTLAEAHCTR